MIQVLSAIGYGIVGFAVLAVVGLVVIESLGNAVGGTANDTAQTVMGYITDNLVSWIPAIIAIAIGGLMLAYFGGKKSY